MVQIRAHLHDYHRGTYRRRKVRTYKGNVVRRRSATIPNFGKSSYFVESKGIVVSKRKMLTSPKTITNSYIINVIDPFPVVVFKANPRRVAILIQNRSNFSVYIDFDKPATKENSLEIFSLGSYDESHEPPMGIIYMAAFPGVGYQKINVMESYR